MFITRTKKILIPLGTGCRTYTLGHCLLKLMIEETFVYSALPSQNLKNKSRSSS